MNLEVINKWLDEEYGCSYTRLEELHDFYFEKYTDLKEENKQLKEVIDKAIEFINLINGGVICSEFEPYLNDILKILSEVSE